MPSTNFHPMLNSYIIAKVFKNIDLKSSAIFYTLLFGSMISDSSIYIFYFYYLLIGKSPQSIFGELYYSKPGWIAVKNYLHSIPLSLIFFLIFFCIDRYYIQKATSSKAETHHQQQIATNDYTQNVRITNDIEMAMEMVPDKSYPDETDQLQSEPDNILEIGKNVDPTCRNCWCGMEYVVILCAYWFLCMFLHSIFDFLLHREDAHSNFVPFTQWKFVSPVSYYEADHYGYIWCFFELIFGAYYIFWIHQIKKYQWKNSRCKWQYILWIIIFILNMLWFIWNAIFSVPVW